MGHVKDGAPFISLGIAVLTVSDSRGYEEDDSGDLLANRIVDSGHALVERCITPDNIYQIRAVVSQWIADQRIQGIVVNGGTGFTSRDHTPEALIPLLDTLVDGYGELFRTLSFETIGTSTIQSRAVGGVANNTLVFAMPGSPKACAMAWDKVICPQLDSRTRPCNFVAMVLPDPNHEALSCAPQPGQPAARRRA
jgi:molybdenum cofactor biosynthesis protein B